MALKVSNKNRVKLEEVGKVEVKKGGILVTIKLVIAYIIAWLLYFIGDSISRMMHTEYTAWLYPLYNECMSWSYNVQDWGNAKSPWSGYIEPVLDDLVIESVEEQVEESIVFDAFRCQYWAN